MVRTGNNVDMAILHCRNCGADIDSDARRSQCRACGELFPFMCVVCCRKLRGPFPVFEDERYLTNDADPQTLCGDHFLRKCPDCHRWFGADENPGFFRCPDCAAKFQNKASVPVPDDEPDEDEYVEEVPPRAAAPQRGPRVAGRRLDPNTIVLAGAGCAFVALIGWFLLAR